MKNLKYLSFVLMGILLISCSSSTKVLNSWVNKDENKGQKYYKIFILALTQNQSARNIVESDLVSAATGLGLKSEKSSDYFIKAFDKKDAPSKESIIAKAKELNCDLIFTVSLLDSKTETHYVPGSSYYAPYPAYGYYGGFGPYYGYYSPIVYDPGYYTTSKVYYIEGNLFDTNTEKILWSVQSATYNPTDLKSFSASYSKLIMHQADEDGLFNEQ